MHDKINDSIILGTIIAILLALAWVLAGCAKDVGEDRVPAIAAIFTDTSSDVVFLGLKAIDTEAPEQTAATIIDIGVVMGALQDYEDGNIGILDAKNSILALFDRLRERFELLPDSVYVDAGIVVVKAGANLLALYVPDYDAPEEVGTYIAAIRAGFLVGIERFNEFKHPPVPPVLSTAGEFAEISIIGTAMP